MNRRPVVILLGLILLLAGYLRLHHLQTDYYLGAEVGDNYLAIKNSLTAHRIPLLGPPTSHPWLYFGPLFYWLMAPVLSLSGFNPLTADYFLVGVSLLVICENYYFVSRLFSRSTALLSTLLISISPLWINMARDSRFFSLVTVFFYPFVYFLLRRNSFLTGIFLGLMLNFHFSPLVFMPLCLFVCPARKKFFLGLGLTQLPILIFNLTHGFTMLSKLLVWLPYRAIGLSSTPPTQSGVSAWEFLSTSLTSGNMLLSLLICVGILLSLKLISANRSWLSLWALLVTGLVGIALHRHPPFHYYLPLFPLPAILLGGTLASLAQAPKTRLLVAVFITFILFYNLTRAPQSPALTLNDQIEAVRAIITDASGIKYQLSRVGPFDFYPGNYAQNYHYLLWWQGNEPVSSSNITYTIYETSPPSSVSGTLLFSHPGLIVSKHLN